MTLPLGADPPDPSSAGEPVAAVLSVGTTGQIVRGSLWYLGGQVVTLLAALVATPFVIRMLGPERYGVLALINLLIVSLAFSDLGMGIASTRFGAEAHARGDDDGEAAAIWSSLLVSALPATLAAAALALGARPLLQAVHLPAHLQGEATMALRLASVGIVARTATGILNTPQLVRARMRLHAAVTTAGSVAQIAGIPVALSLGASLAGVGAVIGGAGIATAVGQALLARRILPRLARPRFERRLLGRLARFGGALVVGIFSSLLLASADKIFLTRLVSVEALAYYTVAFSLANLLLVPAASLFQAMLPTFATYQANGRWEELARIYGELLRGILLLMPLFALVLCLGARPFFTFWAGPRFGTASTPLFFVMVVGLLATAGAYVPGTLLVAVGRADFAARYHLLELVPYLVLALAMTAAWGSAGAAGAWSLRLIVALPVFLRAARHSLGRSPHVLRGGAARYAGALTLLFLPALAAVALDLPWPWRLAAGGISITCYLWVLYARLLEGSERAWLCSRFLSVAAVASSKPKPPA
jgi:O-antigen/teichoic acid export membrane protein